MLMFVHVEAAAATACECETVGASQKGSAPTVGGSVSEVLARWSARASVSGRGQPARTAGIASSRYHNQNARRAATSVFSTGIEFVAPETATEQL